MLLQALCIISSSYMNSNWSHSPEMAKFGYDPCDLDLWPWPFAWTSLLSLVFSPDNFVMIWWQEHSEQERLKCRNTLGCLEQYAAQNSKYARPQSHHNPQPKRSSSSGTLNIIPPWNIHTVKQSMPRSCFNGCSLNWVTPPPPPPPPPRIL